MPIKQTSVIGGIMEAQEKSKHSKRKAASMPPWRLKLTNQEDHSTPVRRNHTSIWDDHMPAKRHTRRLSSSKVGLSGSSPVYVEFAPPDRTIEQKRKEELKMKLEIGSIDDLWQIYVESSAWHQDDGQKWPIQNYEFAKVRRKITKMLRTQMKHAIDTDDAEDLEAALHQADGKVQILAVQSNDQFPELNVIMERLEEKHAEKKAAMKALEKSNQPSLAFQEREKVRGALDAALKSKDIVQISAAMSKCLEGSLDVQSATKHLRLTSDYFLPEDQREKSLFAPDGFKGEGRMLHIVNLGPEMDLNHVQRLCSMAGVTCKVYTDIKAVTVGREDRKSGSRKGTSVTMSLGAQLGKIRSAILDDPEHHSIVVISGPEPAALESDTSSLAKLLQFNKAGGGLGIIGSGNRGGNSFPLIRDANLILQVLGLDKLWGHKAAGRILKKMGTDKKQGGFDGQHPIFSGITQLQEGFSITDLDDSVLKKGMRELARNSQGQLLTALREPSKAFKEAGGPLLIHGSPVQLLCNKDSPGVETFVSNLMLYLVLRPDDVEEVYVP